MDLSNDNDILVRRKVVATEFDMFLFSANISVNMEYNFYILAPYFNLPRILTV